MRTATRPPRLALSTPGALRAWRRDPIGLLTRAAALGDVVCLPLPRFQAWLLTHPDLIGDVLVSAHRDFMKGPTMQAAKLLLGESLLTTEREVHHHRRRLIQPIFHQARIGGYGETMVEGAERAALGWPDGATLDLHGEMTRLTLSVVGATLFGADIEAAEAHAVGEALSEVQAQFGRIFSFLFPLLLRLPLPANRRFERARERLDEIVYRMIAARRAAGGTGGDLLSLLIRAEEEGRAGLTDREVRDEAMTLFLAGHETTAAALSWTWLLLSQHPHAEARLHAEVDEVLGGRLPAVGDLPRLRFTEAVLSESMRLYPPAWAIGRRALSDHRVGDYTIPAGAVLVVSPYLVHRDPRWWPEPTAFRPARWLGVDRSERPRLAYFPFGAGPRMCIGEPFAWMEGVLVLATIARRWRLRLAPGHRVELQPAVTLRPRDGMPMIAERRPVPA